MNHLRLCVALCLLLSLLGLSKRVDASDRPNVLLIMVDDMGFSDLGCYGGEIDTPNLDRLARDGVRFSQFYNNGRCCPTRAALLTGLQPHQTGIGWMTNPPNKVKGEQTPPAYQGYLNHDCATIAEALKEAGYATLMSGKWHLGYNGKDRWPLQRGFEQFYGCIAGATHFFHPAGARGITIGNEPVTELASTTDRPYYTTDAFTDHAIRFIREEREGKDRPFFMYLAYTAPHWPIHAHDQEIDKYRGKYMMGWDKLRERRYRRQIELGLIDPAWPLSPRDKRVPAWSEVEQGKKAMLDLRMASYAGMIDRVDQNIGKLIDALKQAGQYENTLVLFLSDNGACAEVGNLGSGHPIDDRAPGGKNVAVGRCWANASSTPYRLYKHFTHEGGAATPFFMHWPARVKPHEPWYREPATLIDVMPTILEVTGAAYPETYHGRAMPPLEGVSLVPAFVGQALARRTPIFLEHENNASIRDGQWKLVGRGVATAKGTDAGKWELYDMLADGTELNDLADRQPERVQRMAQQWEKWAHRVGVYPKPQKKSNK